jgi:predicted  nucleic acid-binding Zn-ribbon protein
MSARQRALKEKSVVAKLVKDLNKRMNDFEVAVDELKILKESLNDMHDEITAQEAENANTLARLKSELKENRTRVLNEAASSCGKVIMSADELEELRREVEKWKNECSNVRAAVQEEVEEKVEEATAHQLKILSLQHECKTAELSAANTNYEKEIENLKEAIARMTGELDSQKKLTADVARVGRPVAPVPAPQ